MGILLPAPAPRRKISPKINGRVCECVGPACGHAYCSSAEWRDCMTLTRVLRLFLLKFRLRLQHGMLCGAYKGKPLRVLRKIKCRFQRGELFLFIPFVLFSYPLLGSSCLRRFWLIAHFTVPSLELYYSIKPILGSFPYDANWEKPCA